jgi:cysteine synthase
MAASPDKMEPAGRKRDDILGAMITHTPGENARNTFNYVAGYPYKAASEVKVTVGDQTFTLFTQEDRAWAPDQATDDSIATAIKKGSKMVVKGTSARGTLTTDTFSLKGSGDAYAAISKACGVE